MPRVRALAKPDRRKMAVLEEIRGTMAAIGMTARQLSDQTRIPYSTITKRLRAPETMTLAEYWKIQDVVRRERKRYE